MLAGLEFRGVLFGVELFNATRQDRQQRAELRDAAPPRGRMPKGLSARERMQRKLRTRRGRAIYRQRGASVEPVFGQMKERQGAGRFSMRGLTACRGEWHLQAATHNLRKLHRESVRGAESTGSSKTTVRDRKSTRLNSSHANISYAVFCLKKKKTNKIVLDRREN